MTSRLERLISLDAYIRSGVYPGVEQLCRLFEVQPRTVYQDLKELREKFGLDIRFDRERNGYYNADPSKRLPTMALSREEVLLLVVACEMLCSYAGESFRGGLANALQLLADDREPGLQGFVQQRVAFEGAHDNISRSQFVEVLLSCSEEQVLRLSLLTNTEAPMLLKPEKVTHDQKGWVVVGRLENNEQRVVRLHDIASLEILVHRDGHWVSAQRPAAVETSQLSAELAGQHDGEKE